jgi:hypothetical protein
VSQVYYCLGKTVHQRNRLTDHIRGARNGVDRTYKGRWIRGLLAQGAAPTFRVLMTCAGGRHVLGDAERQVIALFRSVGANLTNLTDGGEGTLGHKHSPEAIRKSADARRGRKMSDEFCDTNRRAHLGQVFTPEHRQKISAAGKGRPKSAEWRARMSQIRLAMPYAVRCRKHTTEERSKMSAAHLARNRGHHNEP